MAVQVLGTPPFTPRYNASSTNIAANQAATVVEGGLLIAHVHYNSATGTLTNLQGFTQHDTRAGTGAGASFILSKVATATDAANAGTAAFYTFVASGSAAVNSAVIFCVSGQSATGVEAVSGNFITPTTTAPVIPAVTTLGADRMLIWFIDSNSTTNVFTTSWPTPPSNANELHDSNSGTNRSMAGAFETQAASGTSGTRTLTMSATEIVNVHGIAIEPAALASDVTRVVPSFTYY